MFLTTPFVRMLVNRLYQSGKIDEVQKNLLISQDRQINVVITGAALLLLMSLFL